MMESLENLKVGDDVLVYDKNGLFEAIFYVERTTNNYLVIGGAKFSKKYGWMCCNHNMFAKLATERHRTSGEEEKEISSVIMC